MLRLLFLPYWSFRPLLLPSRLHLLLMTLHPCGLVLRRSSVHLPLSLSLLRLLLLPY